MKFCIKDYLKKLLGVSDNLEGMNIKFTEETLEESYKESLKNSEYES